MLLNFARPLHPLKSRSGQKGDEGVCGEEDERGGRGEEKRRRKNKMAILLFLTLLMTTL